MAPSTAAVTNPGRDGHPEPGDDDVGQYLIDRLQAQGVGHVFGIPGDYVLTLYKMIQDSPIRVVGMTREDSAGFAADAYARLHGLGCVCVTYCVGGLSLCNSIAGAYAEKSPVIVLGGLAGAPGAGAEPAAAPQGQGVRDPVRGVREDHRGGDRARRPADRLRRDRPGARGGRAVQAAGLHRDPARPGAGQARGPAPAPRRPAAERPRRAPRGRRRGRRRCSPRRSGR